MSKKTFLGFGFGAIQTGLFLYEAQKSANFDRLVIAYRRPEVIESIRNNNGVFTINIAHSNYIEQAKIGPIEIYDLNHPDEQKILIDAVAKATEIATALSSVKDYQSTNSSSIHYLLSEGLKQKIKTSSTPSILYTAENDNHAAEKLEQLVKKSLGPSLASRLDKRVQFLNTVIGKMSGTVRDLNTIKKHNLEPITPDLESAFLVESFSEILISKIHLKNFNHGINQFQEKTNLLAFEEAKLYGHNATHALAAYIGMALGVMHIRDLQDQTGVLEFLQNAFIHESGAALIAKYNGLDALFTEQGYTHFANDLLRRMMNPFLNDSVARVARDPMRKLGWNDRLIGTMRLALTHGMKPARFAFGAAAALESLTLSAPEAFLKDLWQQSDSQECQEVLNLIKEARVTLKQWKAQDFPDLQTFFKA